MPYTKHKNIPPHHAADHADQLNDSILEIRKTLSKLPDDGLRHLVLCTVHAELALHLNLDPFIAAAGIVSAHRKIKEFK